MTSEEIERILQTVAQNQARADEEFVMLLKSQNRYEERLATISDIMHDLADKQLRNEERFAETDKRFAELAAAQMRYEARKEKLEGSYELLESFVRDFRNETRDYFAETDKRLAEFINETNRRFTHFAETDKRLAEFINETNRRFAGTDEQLKALIAAQARTDEQIRSLLDRNGSTAAPKEKVKKAKKTGKRGSVK